MTEFTVKITSRSSGIIFGVGKKQHIIRKITNYSLATKLGLIAGDVLLMMNGLDLTYPLQMIESGQYGFTSIQSLFNSQQIPFTATFQRLDSNITFPSTPEPTAPPPLHQSRPKRRNRHSAPVNKVPAYSSYERRNSFDLIDCDDEDLPNGHPPFRDHSYSVPVNPSRSSNNNAANGTPTSDYQHHHHHHHHQHTPYNMHLSQSHHHHQHHDHRQHGHHHNHPPHLAQWIDSHHNNHTELSHHESQDALLRYNSMNSLNASTTPTCSYSLCSASMSSISPSCSPLPSPSPSPRTSVQSINSVQSMTMTMSNTTTPSLPYNTSSNASISSSKSCPVPPTGMGMGRHLRREKGKNEPPSSTPKLQNDAKCTKSVTMAPPTVSLSVNIDALDAPQRHRRQLDGPLIRKHINQRLAGGDHIYFDRVSETESNGKMMIISKGLRSGYHEWSIRILKCDIEIQEFGVVSNADVKRIQIADGGLKDTVSCGSKALYGNEMATDSSYYGTWDENGRRRCFRDLSQVMTRRWCTGDIIKIRLDLDRWRIRFCFNDQKVKKVMSLEKGRVYHPVISFAGNCQYKLLL